MQPDQVDQELIQRCRKAWWTIVVVDRQISCLIGLPIQVRDEDITTPLPVFPDSNQRNASLTIQVGLSRALAHVVNSTYTGKIQHEDILADLIRSRVPKWEHTPPQLHWKHPRRASQRGERV
jgi:hypothetical protein